MTEFDDTIGIGNIFLDNAEMTVDSKLRVGIPERFMKVLKTICPGDADKLGVVPSPDFSIKLLPYPEFLKEVERWKSLNDQLSAHRTILNFCTSLAKVVPLDGQNRIKLTPQQAKFCKIKSDVVIVGAINCMKVYTPEIFEEMIAREIAAYNSASDAVAERYEAAEPLPSPPPPPPQISSPPRRRGGSGSSGPQFN